MNHAITISMLRAVFANEQDNLNHLLEHKVVRSAAFDVVSIIGVDYLGYIIVDGNWLFRQSIAMGVAPLPIGSTSKGTVYRLLDNVLYVSDHMTGMIWTSEDGFKDDELVEFMDFINKP